MVDMTRFIGFVDYAFDGVLIPANRMEACYAGIQAWSDTSYCSLAEGLETCRHEFKYREGAGLQLTWIHLDTEWDLLEPFYQFLAPFVLPGGEVRCTDEEQQQICYRFQDGRVLRIRGRVVFDGMAVAL